MARRGAGSSGGRASPRAPHAEVFSSLPFRDLFQNQPLAYASSLKTPFGDHAGLSTRARRAGVLRAWLKQGGCGRWCGHGARRPGHARAAAFPRGPCGGRAGNFGASVGELIRSTGRWIRGSAAAALPGGSVSEPRGPPSLPSGRRGSSAGCAPRARPRPAPTGAGRHLVTDPATIPRPPRGLQTQDAGCSRGAWAAPGAPTPLL